MRLPLIIASILCALTYSEAIYATPTKSLPGSRKLGLNIKVQGGGWGDVPKETIETVLYSVADALLSKLPKKLNAPIVVTHTDSNPVALYERGPDGEYQVQLHARESNWHLYIYEFAHELCHILSNYEENVGPDKSKYNQWFEETLCETASLFTLKHLAASWEKNPGLPNGLEEARRLNRFFDLLISEGHRQLPRHAPLATWLDHNEEQMRQNPYLRQKNEVVANLLLPLFERNPENWSTLAYLNLDPDTARSSLRDYLNHWYQYAPAEHKRFIADVLSLFQIQEVTAVANVEPSLAPLASLAAAPASSPEAPPKPQDQKP